MKGNWELWAGPGVGKTTRVNSILLILRAKGVKYLLCAATGRAPKRLTETTGAEAKTIHRLLEINPATGRFTKDESSPWHATYWLWIRRRWWTCCRCTRWCGLFPITPDSLVGDVDQLPFEGRQAHPDRK
jgi:hypothetical protein